MKKPIQSTDAAWNRHFAEMHAGEPPVQVENAVMQRIALTPAPMPTAPQSRVRWWMIGLVGLAALALLGVALLATSWWQHTPLASSGLSADQSMILATIVGFSVISISLFLLLDTVAGALPRKRKKPISV